jgi:hypothetical protein
VVLLVTSCGDDGGSSSDGGDGADQAEQIGDEVFAAMSGDLEPTIKGSYLRTPLPEAERCAPTDGEPWRGRQSWDLAGDVVSQDEVWSSATEHLESAGWEVRRYHKPRSGVLGLTAQRDDGNEGLDLIVSTNGATSMFVYVGPCAAADLGFDPPWVEGEPTAG